MADESLRILAPDPKTHMPEVLDLVSKVFDMPDGYYQARKRFRRRLIGPTNFLDPVTSRVGLIDGRIVTFVGVWDYQMRIGTARLRTAGIGMVATHGDYRGRGLMDRTFRACMDAAREQGYDLSVLFGIENFYDRYGFVPAWPETVWEADTAALPAERPHPPAKRLAAARSDALWKIFNRESATHTGTAVRPTRTETPYATTPLVMGWSGPRKPLAGYTMTMCKGNVLEWMESGGDAGQVLRVLGSLARRCKCKTVRFHHLHSRHPLCVLLRRGNCRARTTYQRNGGAMVRTVNLLSTLRKMEGELSRRLKTPDSSDRSDRSNRSDRSDRSDLSNLSDGSDRSTSVLIADKRETCRLEIGGARVRVAGAPERLPGQSADASGRARNTIRGGNHIAQLLIGTGDPWEIAEAAGMRVTGEARTLLPILFPAQEPQLNAWDRF